MKSRVGRRRIGDLKSVSPCVGQIINIPFNIIKQTQTNKVTVIATERVRSVETACVWK